MLRLFLRLGLERQRRPRFLLLFLSWRSATWLPPGITRDMPNVSIRARSLRLNTEAFLAYQFDLTPVSSFPETT
jgi:hypothetical protein